MRSNTTVARPAVEAERGRAGSAYVLRGHKWFTSAPMSDAFLTLAQTEGGLSCFLVPRWIAATGERNHGFEVTRLKNKVRRVRRGRREAGVGRQARSEAENDAVGRMCVRVCVCVWVSGWARQCAWSGHPNRSGRHRRTLNSRRHPARSAATGPTRRPRWRTTTATAS